jgi:hypothetical protein
MDSGLKYIPIAIPSSSTEVIGGPSYFSD